MASAAKLLDSSFWIEFSESVTLVVVNPPVVAKLNQNVVAKLNQIVVAKLNQIAVAKLNQIVVARAMVLVNLAILVAFLVRVVCYHHYSLVKAVVKLNQNVVVKLNQNVVAKLNQIVVVKLNRIVVVILAAQKDPDGLYWTTCSVVSENPADVTRPTAVTPVATQVPKKQPRCPQHRLLIPLHSCRRNDVSFKPARLQSFAKRQFT